MYSPKIYPELIPCLYHVGQEQAVPMTWLVNRYVYQGLIDDDLGIVARSLLPKAEQVFPAKYLPTVIPAAVVLSKVAPSKCPGIYSIDDLTSA